ncbi:MAG: LPD38 domain-containing protein [Candidatus Competibacter sp.]
MFERRPVAITELTGEEFGSNLDKKALARAADALLRKLQAGPPLANDDTGWHLVVGKQDRKKMGDNSDLSAASSKTVAKLADVVRQAVLADTHPDVEHRNPEVSAIHRLYAPARINGALYRVKLTVKDYSESYGRRNLHALEAVEIESALSPGTVPAPTPDKRVRQQAQPTTTEREISIPQLLQGAIRDSDGQPFAPDVRKSTAGQRATPGEEGVAQTPETFGGRSKLSVPQAADSSGSKRTTEAISVDPDAVPVDARNIGALREWLLSQADFKTPVVNRDTGRSIGFTRGNLKDSLKRKGEAQRKAYGGLRQLLESALFDTREPSDRAHLAGQDVYYAAMRLGEATYAITIKVDVARAAHTSTYKDHKAIEIEVTPAVNKAQADERTTFGYRDNSRPTRSGAGFTLRDLKDRFNSPTAPRPSRGDSAGNLPLTPAQARAQLADALGERHIEALEQSGRLIIHRDDPTRTGAAGFVDRDGVIHLVAPNLENGDALSVALHEALHVAKDERFTEGDRAKIRIAHAALRLFGLKNFIGNPGFTDLARQVRRLAAQGDQTALDAIAKARREDPNNADEESVAYLSQYADINKPLVQRVLAAIRAALYRMGLKVQLTADDVRALALSALKNQARAAAKKTRTARARGAQPAFSRLDDPLRQARNFSEARETAKAFLGKPLTSQDGLIASLSRNNIDKMLSASAARKSVSVREHVLAVANLDLLFSRSLEGWAKTDKHQDPNVKAIHRLFAPMVVGDQARLVKITVKEFSIPEQGNRIYSVEALEVTDESPVPEMVDADRADGSRLLTGPTGHVETLIQRIRDFNSGTAYSLPATEDDAAEQARLWEEFQQIRSQFKEREARATAFERWFGEGTEGITARDGKALVLYHGTPTEFYRFDAGRSGINSQHPTSGLGFFMTADRGAAARYGSNVLELHAKIDKPYFLTDADLMAVDSVETAVKFKRRLQEKGHDGAVVSGPGMAPYVIAFESRQVKLASNQNPTDSPDFRFSRSAMKSVEANIRRGLDALTKALLDKTSVHRAMYRQGLGWVDFVWGSEGRVTPSGKTKGAMGIAHILEARQRKDGMSRAEAEKLAYDLIEVIARGSEIRRYTFADTANVTLELGHHEAVLTKTQGSNAWVLSGWEVKPGATGVGNGTPRATLNASTPTQGDQGAGNTQSLSPSDPNRYSRPGRPVGPAELPAETKAQAFQRAVQDKFVRFQVVQDWVKKSGINLTPSADVYGAEALAPKKTAAETETAREKILKPLIARAAKNGWALSGGDLLAAIEDGQPLPATFKPSVGEYLHAAHAKERNAAIAKINPQYRDGGSGLTDAQADAILARYRGVRGFSLFERLAADFRGITDLTRSKLLGAGIISKETADAWRTAYSRYVPLKGGPEGSAQPSGTGPGISVAGRQRRALGHALRDENIVENIWRDHERAIALGHKQEVARALREFLRQANHSRIGTEGQPEKRAVLAQGWVHQVWIEGSPLGAFQSYNEARAAMAQDSLDTGRALSKYAVRHQMADQSVVYMGRPMLADNEVALYEDGQLVRLQLNDELLARAARNLGVDAANGLLKMGQSFNRWLSGAYTGYNPEFILTNVARDMTAGTINLTGKYGIKTAGRALAAYPGAVKALWRYIRTGHDPLVERYRAAGGSTGAAYLSDLERIGSDIKRVFQDLQGARETWAGGDRAGAVRVAVADKIRVVGRRIENLNKIGENAFRVATFKTLLDAGKSEVEAARAAGEVTVNFNRKGELTAQLGGLYLFFNPSVQGTKIMWDALFKGPHRRQAQALAGGLALLAFSIAQSARGGSDDDEKRWQRIQSYTKDRNLVIPIGQELLTIPVPYGYGAFWSLGNILSDLMSGEDGVKAGIRLASTVFEQFSPIGNPFAGDEASVENLLTFLPTAIKPAMSVAMNRTELGRPVMPEVKAWEPGQPDSRRMWRSTQGTMWERAAEAMNRWSGGDRYQGGLVDVSPETLKLIWTTFAGGAGQFATDAANLPIMMYQGAGETIEPREIPILRRFFKTATIQDARAVFNAQAGAIQEALATFNAARRDRNFEAARDIQSEHRELLALGRTLRSAQQAVRARRQMEDEIGRSDLPLAEKRRQLDALEQKEEAIYSKFHDLFLAAKRREAA